MAQLAIEWLRLPSVVVACVLIALSDLVGQGRQPTGANIASAPTELSVDGVRIRLRAEARVLSVSDSPTPAAELDLGFTLLIDGPIEVATLIKADRVWLRSADSIAAGQLEPGSHTQLTRIDQGPWMRTLRAGNRWPRWLGNADSAEVVTMIMRDTTPVGYVRLPIQVINYPRMAEIARRESHQIKRDQKATYFGAIMGGDLRVMQGIYRGLTFEAGTVEIEEFPLGTPLRALDRRGRSGQVRIDTIPVQNSYGGSPWDYAVSRYDAGSSRWVPAHDATCFDSLPAPSGPAAISAQSMDQRRDCSNRLLAQIGAEGYRDATLFWIGPDSVRLIQPISIQLDSAVRALLEERARQLWSDALNQLSSAERPKAVHLGVRRNERLSNAPGLLISSWQVILDHADGWSDPRGSVFFVYSEVDHRIRYASFGHPEWSPGSNLRQVRPYIYFAMGSDSKIYCLTEYGGAWESSGMALFDIVAAKPVLVSN